jgi:formimidoylglutamate deiminase
MTHTVKCYRFDAIWRPKGWLKPAYVGTDPVGTITHIADVPPNEAVAIEAVNGVALPGFSNSHAHAFQYAMAGLADTHQNGHHDDFWSWRESMYTCALGMNPDQLEAIAAGLYAEMLRHGYTHVAEFHYLHHDQDGKPYTNLAEMGERLIAAAHTAGINITLIPVMYQNGNFGHPFEARQRRFISGTKDAYFSLLDRSAEVVSRSPHATLGFGVHSLRAVNPDDIPTVYEEGPKDIPFHLHIAEQKKEVADCVSFLGQRPLQWLSTHIPFESRLNLVHCTHLDDAELNFLGASNANVVLCPSTEGNLGDGIFRLSEFLACGGSFSLGTDSHIALDPLEDLRWLDYGQRLTTNRRNTVDNPIQLLQTVDRAGKLAMTTRPADSLVVGSRLDAVVFNSSFPLLQRTEVESALPTILYTLNAAAILGTQVNGRWIVKNQEHYQRKEIWTRFNGAIRAL